MADALPRLPSAPLGELQGQLPDDPLGAPPQLPSIGKREPLRFPFGGRGGRRTGGTRPPLASVEQLTRAAAQNRARATAGTTPAPARPRPQRAAPQAPIIIQTPAPQAAPQAQPQPPRPTAAQRRAAARQAAAPLRAYVGIGAQNPQDAADAAAQRGRIRRGLALRQRRPGQPAQPQNPPQAQNPQATQTTPEPALNAIRARRAAQYAQMRGVLDALRNPPANPPAGGGTQP